MKLMRRMLPAIVAVAVLALTLPTRTLAATTYQFHVTAYTAEAYFSSWNGPVVTEAYVTSGQNVGGTKNVMPYTFVYADQYDTSTNTFLAQYFGSVNTSALQINKTLTSASLAGSVSGQDINGNPVSLSFNLTWTGSGSVVRNVSNNHFQGQGFSVNSHFNGSTRYGQATGSVSAGTIAFSDATSQEADLNHLTSGSTTISF